MNRDQYELNMTSAQYAFPAVQRPVLLVLKDGSKCVACRMELGFQKKKVEWILLFKNKIIGRIQEEDVDYWSYFLVKNIEDAPKSIAVNETKVSI